MTRPRAQDDPLRLRRSLACTVCRAAKAKCDGEPPPELPRAATRTPTTTNSSDASAFVKNEINTTENASSLRKRREHNPVDLRLATHGNGKPCARCTRIGEDCSWVPSRRKGRPRRLLPRNDVAKHGVKGRGGGNECFEEAEAEEEDEEEEEEGEEEQATLDRLKVTMTGPGDVDESSLMCGGGPPQPVFDLPPTSNPQQHSKSALNHSCPHNPYPPSSHTSLPFLHSHSDFPPSIDCPCQVSITPPMVKPFPSHFFDAMTSGLPRIEEFFAAVSNPSLSPPSSSDSSAGYSNFISNHSSSSLESSQQSSHCPSPFPKSSESPQYRQYSIGSQQQQQSPNYFIPPLSSAFPNQENDGIDQAGGSTFLDSFADFELPDLGDSLKEVLFMWEPDRQMANRELYLRARMPPFKPEPNLNAHCDPEQENEVLSLLDTFFNHAAHLLNILTDHTDFIRHHFRSCSPLLLASLCAFAVPIHSQLHPGCNLSKDYIWLANALADLPASDEFDPIERIISFTILTQIEYGHGKPVRCKLLLKEAANLAIHHNLHQGKFDSVLGKSFGRNPDSYFSEEVARMAWWEIYVIDVRLQFAVSIRDSGTVFTKVKSGEVKIDLPESWMPKGPDQEMPAEGFLLRTLSFLCSLPFSPPLPVGAPNRSLVFDSIDKTLANFLVVSDGIYRRVSEQYRASGSMKDRIAKEAAFQAFTTLSSGRIHLHQIYQIPNIHLHFDTCSLQPVTQNGKSAIAPFPTDSALPPRSPVQHLNPPAPTNKGKRKRDGQEGDEVNNEIATELGRISVSPIESLTKVIAAAQGILNIVKFDQDPNNLPENKTCSSQGRSRRRVYVGQVPGLTSSGSSGSYPSESFHNPYYTCAMMVSAFGLLLGICSVVSVLNRQVASKRHQPSQPAASNPHKDPSASTSVFFEAMKRIKTLTEELDFCAAAVRQQAGLWKPMSEMRADKIIECKELVLKALADATGGLPEG